MTDQGLPNVSLFRTVEAICRRGGFSAAARELGVTHSAVSQQVARLEASLGRRLFERGAGGVRATSAALAIAEGYRRSTALLEQTLSGLDDEGGVLAISLPRSLAGAWMATRLGRLARIVQPIAVEVHADLEAPDLGRIDAAVLLRAAAPEDGEARLLYEERLTPLCSPDFQAQHRLHLPESARWAPLISHAWPQWKAWFAAAGAPPPPGPPAHRLADPALALEAAVQGQGLALGCAFAESARLADGRLIAPYDIAVATGRRAWLVWPAASRKAVAIGAFSSWLIAEITALQSGRGQVQTPLKTLAVVA